MQFNNFCRNLQREITQMTFNNISVLTVFERSSKPFGVSIRTWLKNKLYKEYYIQI